MELLSEKQKNAIIKNCINATQDINVLSKQGYNFLYLSSGFIAHYDINGFKFEYEEPGKLKQEILDYQGINQYKNFSPRDENYDYYMQKKEIYNAICDGIISLEQKQMKPSKKNKELEFDFGR